MARGGVVAGDELIVNNEVDVSNTMPADYSFRKLKHLDDLEGARPRVMRVGRDVVRGPSGRILSSALWLNNNNLESMRFITCFVNTLLEAPNQLQWLDFSFNNIKEIHEDILKFTNLKILYLHGNCINSLSNVGMLKCLKKLRSLTLHGCPVETIPFYRQHVISMIPQLKNLDFVTITPKEANAPPPPGFNAADTELEYEDD
ncbi:leucine-rich repeat-containing protein 51-like [Cimex lectularius]|uniref:Leucine-rich repeat-containing protein 51 n=1 Tax=Cimex lectularius TaxID=79782 RepID=A0A8I6S098_CIMLE|nr:leucine-rich repeat-containing protein 51-like [Cimex lectularius]